jgi:cob(I)alamin adenosyltransferase
MPQTKAISRDLTGRREIVSWFSPSFTLYALRKNSTISSTDTPTPMPKIYTRTGDTGDTGLFGSPRVRKDNLRIEAIGDVDELNAVLGVARAELARTGAAAEIDQVLARLQHQLFDVGAELATPDPAAGGTTLISDTQVAGLESVIDVHQARLEPLRQFILPGGSPTAAELHLARCVCRRAERRLVALAANAPIRGELLRYLNRASDLLFVLARAANSDAGEADVTWKRGA